MSKLDEVYEGLERSLTLTPESIDVLRAEWLAWFEAYGIMLTPEAVDVAVTVASAMVKNFAEIAGDAPTLQRRNPALARVLQSMMISTGILSTFKARPV